MPTPEKIIIAFLVFAIVALIFYVLRTSGKRETRLIEQKESLIQILAKYTDALRELTAQIAIIEKRVERVEILMTAMVGRSGGLNVSGTTVNVRDVVGADETNTR